MKVYYNEFDKKKCAALSQLMKDGHIRKGEIDDRSIHKVRGSDLKDYGRCHFFAGIGLWDYALDLARWPENMRVWTGSCPCQPFSTAGRQKGKADDRHVWPEWLRLIEECQPPVIFGEQVATAIAHGWLDDVYQGLEAKNYAVGSAVLPACSVGAPHKRDRLWFVGNAEHDGPYTGPFKTGDGKINDGRKEEQNSSVKSAGASPAQPLSDKPMVRPQREGLEGLAWDEEGDDQQRWIEAQPDGSVWSTGIWIDCPDEKQRLVEPRIHLLADGYSERVGLLHSAGDAIVPQVAAEFIQSSMGAL